MTSPQGQPTPPPQLLVKVPDEVEAGVFAHGAQVSNSVDAFVFDFITLLPNTQPQTARVVSRVFVPPAQAAEMLKALSSQLSAYEDQYGPIKPYPGGGLAGPTPDS